MSRFSNIQQGTGPLSSAGLAQTSRRKCRARVARRDLAVRAGRRYAQEDNSAKWRADLAAAKQQLVDRSVLDASPDTEITQTLSEPQDVEEYDPYWHENSVDPAIFEDEEDELETLTAPGWGVEVGGRTSGNELVEDISLLEEGWGLGEEASAAGSSGAGSRGRTEDEDEAQRWREGAMASLPGHVVRELRSWQAEADALKKEVKVKAKESGDAFKTHRRLRIISGSAAGKRLVSRRSAQTRPMMEKVRAAVFSMLHSFTGSLSNLPSGCAWLDLFAGTGSVGIEAVSRGAATCHFIELDPWVVEKVLAQNVAACGMGGSAIMHTMRAEEYLRRAKLMPEYAQRFDFVSVCPPYLAVSYEELFELLEGSPLLHEESFVVVEYPQKSTKSVPQTVNGLVQLRNRKFGRTNVVIFGPGDAV